VLLLPSEHLTDSESPQVRFNLSNQQEWNRSDGHFDYEEFFWLIVSLFEDDKVFADRTIALYNR
jgi:hypothetical protein